MTNSEQILLSALEGDAAIATHVRVGETSEFRIYPMELPQGPTYPAITYQRISNARVNSFDAGGGIDNPRLQVDCWALTRQAARELAMEVKRVAENAAQLGAWLISDSEFVEDDVTPHLYRVSQDFSTWVAETT